MSKINWLKDHEGRNGHSLMGAVINQRGRKSYVFYQKNLWKYNFMKFETMREEKPFPPYCRKEGNGPSTCAEKKLIPRIASSRKDTFPPCCHEGGNGFFLPHGLKFHDITISQVFLIKDITFSSPLVCYCPIRECGLCQVGQHQSSNPKIFINESC